MTDNILKEFIENAAKLVKETKDEKEKYIKEGRVFVDKIMNEPALILEIVSKLKNMPDVADDIIASDETLKSADDSLKHLKKVRLGYAKQSNKVNEDKESRVNSRKLIKKADEAMDGLTKIMSNIVINLLEKHYDKVMELVLQNGVSPKVKLSERIIVVGGIEYSYLDYIKRLRNYQYKFYSLSSDANEAKMEYYKLLAESDSIIDYMDKLVRRSGSIDFTFKFNPVMPLQFSLDDINEFTENLKLIATITNRLVDRKEVSCMNTDFIKNESGDHFFNTTFEIWDRCLLVYKLNREKGYVIEKDMTAKIDSIGKTVSKKFKWYEKSATTDRRKAVKADYDCALKLIARAAKGSLLA